MARKARGKFHLTIKRLEPLHANIRRSADRIPLRRVKKVLRAAFLKAATLSVPHDRHHESTIKVTKEMRELILHSHTSRDRNVI